MGGFDLESEISLILLNLECSAGVSGSEASLYELEIASQ